MPKGIILIVLFSLLGVVGWMWFKDTQSAEASATTGTPPVEAIMALETPTLAPTATTDYTAQTLESMKATSDEAQRQFELEMLHITQTAEWLDHEELAWQATQVAAEATQFVATQEYLPTYVKLQEASATVESIHATAIIQEATNMIAAPTATVAAARAQAAATFAPIREALLILLVVIGIAIGIFLVALIWQRHQAERQEMRRLEHEYWNPQQRTIPNLSPDDHRPVRVIMDGRDADGYGAVDWTDIPVSNTVLRDVAAIIVSGGRYTVRYMTGEGKPLTRDTTFNALGDWMVKNHIAVRSDTNEYNIINKDFFVQVFEKAPEPPHSPTGI